MPHEWTTLATEGADSVACAPYVSVGNVRVPKLETVPTNDTVATAIEPGVHEIDSEPKRSMNT